MVEPRGAGSAAPAGGPPASPAGRLSALQPAYARARLMLVGLGDRDPADAFCAGLEEAGDGVEAPPEGEAGPGLLFVLAARAALRRGDFAAAARLAAVAMAKDQRDLYAQRLHLAARAGRAPAVVVAPDPELADRFCAKPFEEFETRTNGDVHTCCAAWMPLPIGNIGDASPGAVWDSPAARAVRRSVLDGDYTWCSRLHCPRIADGRLPRKAGPMRPEHRRLAAERATTTPRGPRRVMLSHDRSCNLACPSCRTGFILARKGEVERLNDLAERTLFPLLKGADRVKVTGSGDPFGSAHFRWVLAELARPGFESLRIELQTNGVLCDARAWEELRLGRRVCSVWVSLDAARPETYHVVRRGGDWGRLLDNLEFLAGLRREGTIGELRLDFVVQASNHAEMPEVAEMARRLGADRATFQLVRNWGTFGVAEFRARDIGAPDHPRHADLLATLRDPRLGGPGVDLGNLGALRRRALAGLAA